jgi:hypothetical protein
MPVVASIEFPRADVDALFRQMDRAQKELGRSLGNAVRTATNRVALSIGTSTRVAPKYRKITPMGDQSSNRKFDPKTGKFYYNKRFEVYSDKSRKTFSVWAKNITAAKKKKSVLIARRGLAKATWRRAAQEASADGGVGKGGVTAFGRIVDRHARGKGVFKGDNPWAMMESSLDYAGAALQGGPNAVDTAMERAASAMEHLIDRQIERKLGAK